MAWMNDDGLRVRFDLEKVAERDIPRGEAPGAGETRTIDAIIELADLTTTEAFPLYGTIIPRNSFVEQIELVNITALGGTVTSIDVGLQAYDGTEYDYDGFVDGYSTATSGTKTVYNQGTSGHGVLVGETLEAPGYLTVLATGTTMTGTLAVRVKVLVPGADENPGQFEPS